MPSSTLQATEHSLWYPYKIPIIVLAGESDSGKTLWGLTVDNSCFDFSAAPNIITWDTEGSSVPYIGALQFERVDLPEIAIKRAGKNYKNIDLYSAWIESTKSIKPKQYSVGLLDTATEIEDGLTQYMRNSPGEFGYTSAQFSRAGGLFWGALKAEWKRQLMYVASKFETLVISVHMKSEWKGNSTTGRRIPKGKEVLMDIASLYLTLTRNMKSRVKNQSPKPSGICKWPLGKSRLNRINPETGELQQLLPPFIKDASPNGIRNYLKNPPNFSNLKPSEQALPDLELSSDDKLAIQAGIAADKASCAESDLERIRLEREVQAEVQIPNESYAFSTLKKNMLDIMSMDVAKALLLSRYSALKLTDLTQHQLTDLEQHIASLAKK